MSEGKCMIGDGTPAGAPHPGNGYDGHVSKLPRPEQIVREQINDHMNEVTPEVKAMTDTAYRSALDFYAEQMKREEAEAYDRFQRLLENAENNGLKTGDTVTFVIDKETGGRKGQKLAQFSYIPPDVLTELAEHYGKGIAKYPDDEEGQPNWQRGYSWRLSVDAMERHLNAWLAGEDYDPETGSSHLVAVIWHAFALRWFQLHGKGKDFR